MRPPRSITLAVMLTGAAAGLAGAVTAASAAAAAPRTCHGLPVTVAAHAGHVVGTSGRDVIALTGRATVHAGKGDDIVCGSDADDVVDAGPGDDVVVGRRGDDRLAGGPGRDNLFGEQGDDHLVGGRGADMLIGGSGRDRVDREQRTGAREAQTTDASMPGAMALSLVISPAQFTTMTDTMQIIGTAWVPPTGARTLTGAMIPNLLPANVIAFTPQYGAYVTQQRPTDGTVILTDTNTPVSMPGTVTYMDIGGPPQLVAGPATPGAVQGVTIESTSSGPLWGGLLISGIVNGQYQVSVPTGVGGMFPWGQKTFMPPTQLQIFTGYLGESATQRVTPAFAMPPHITVSFAAGHEVADVSYGTDGVFRQG